MAEGGGIVCPVCRHPLQAGVTICANCGSTIPEDSAEVLSNLMKIAGVGPEEAKTLLEEGVGIPGEDEEEIEDLLEEISGGETLYLCPACGSFMPDDSSTCPGCGGEISHEARLEAPPPPVEEEGGGLYMCPACGAFVSEQADSCTHCGAELLEGEEEGVETLSDTVQVGDITSLDEEVLLCPTCGAFVEDEDAVCGICDTDLESHRPISAGEELAVELEGPACTNCGALLPAPDAECRICRGEVMEDAREPDGEAGHPEIISLEEELDRFIEELESPEAPEPAAVELPTAETEVTVEAERGVAAETAQEEIPSTPERIVLRPISAPAHRRGRRPGRDGSTTGLLHPAREYLVYASTVALGVEYLMSQAAPEGYELAMLIIFGVLLGSGVGLMAGSGSELAPGTVRRSVPTIAGIVLLALVPVLAFLGVKLPVEGSDLILLGAGALMVLAGAILARGRMETTFVWLGGGVLLVLMALARVNTAGLQGLPPDIASLVWAAGGSLVISSFVLVLYHKWASATMAGSIVSGDMRYRRRDYGESLRAYERAIRASQKMESGPNAEVPWYSKGAALVMLDKPREALDCIEKALAINPKSEVALVNKGTALAKMGRHGEALRCYNSALKLNPTYEVAWNNKGNALARRGKYEEAIRCYDEAIKLDTGYRDPWVNKGYVLVQLGDYEAAAECADRATKAASRVSVTPSATGGP